MKTAMLISVFVACALSAPLVSAEDDMAAPPKPAMSMDMDQQLPQMEQNMKNLQLQMDKIHKTTDLKARQKLLDAHMQAMQEQMKAMRGMGGPTMKGGAEHGGMMMGAEKGGMKNDDPMKNQEMMIKRLDMMQMMMEQMMERDQVTQTAPSAPMGGHM